MAIGYATYQEILDVLAEGMKSPTTAQHTMMRRFSDRASRLIDRATGRTFWPEFDTRYWNVAESDGDFWVDGFLLDIDSIAMSDDGGASYTTVASTDYFTLGGDRNEYGGSPIYVLRMNRNEDSVGGYASWYTGQRSLRIAGLWGWHDDYSNAWPDSQDDIEDNPLAVGGTTVTVNDADGADLWGDTPRFQAGQLIRTGTAASSEQMMVRIVTAASTNTLDVNRGASGTTAAEHAQNTDLYVYQPPEIVKQAICVQAVRSWKRGKQGYQDVGAMADLGQLQFVKKLDPEVLAMLYDAGLRRVSV